MGGAVYEAPSSELYATLEEEQVGISLKSGKKTKLSSKAVEDETKGKSSAPMAAPKKIDMCLVVGGFNSSNTTQYKPLEVSPAQAMLAEGLEIKDNFLPEGPLVVGVTSGASTPDSTVGECLQRLLHIKGINV